MKIYEEWNTELIEQEKRKNKRLAVALVLSMIINIALMVVLMADR